MSDIKDSLELWRNASRGIRWVTRFDRIGREESTVIHPNRNFTITPFERQINQDRVADPGMDMFRNGTFTLIRPAVDTDEEEISSPNTYTENELDKLVVDLLNGLKQLEDVVPLITVTKVLDRLEIKLRGVGFEDLGVLEKRRGDLKEPAITRKRIVVDEPLTTKVDEEVIREAGYVDTQVDEPVVDPTPARFDPSEHTVKEVLDHLSENPDDLRSVLADEMDGKNRKTLVDELQDLLFKEE